MVQRKPALKPAHQPICSVCVANYNGRETLDACLRSILEQDCDFGVEIILHDDASTDGSADRLQERFPGVELLLSDENAGFCVSNNRMVDIARGAYVLLLNNDAVLLPDALKCLHQRAVQIGPAILGLPQFEMPSGRLIDRGSLLDPFLNPLPNLDPARAGVGMVMGACLWISRDCWRELGGFPEWFHTLAEDMYLCCRARLLGYPVEVLPVSGFRHWVGRTLGGGKVVEGGLNTSRRRRALSERNKSFVMSVCYPGPALLLFPLHLLLLVLEGIVLTALNRDLSLWRMVYGHCLTECWRQRNRLWRLRREVQSARRVSLKLFFRAHTGWPHKLTLLFRHGFPRFDDRGTAV